MFGNTSHEKYMDKLVTNLQSEVATLQSENRDLKAKAVIRETQIIETEYLLSSAAVEVNKYKSISQTTGLLMCVFLAIVIIALVHSIKQEKAFSALKDKYEQQLQLKK
jgi:hypothetical protein